MKKWKDILLTGMILAAAVMTAGCGTAGERGTVNGTSSSVTAGTGTSAGEVSSSSPAKKEAAKTMQIKVYYPDDQGMKLIAVRRTISLSGGDKYTAAMKALLEGTKEKGQTNHSSSDEAAERQRPRGYGVCGFQPGSGSPFYRRLDR